MNDKPVSVSPAGEEFALPKNEEYRQEFAWLKKIVQEKRDEGKEIVVVLNLGLVGAVIADIIADSTDVDSNPGKFVIGKQRPSTRSFWKTPYIHKGICPVKSDDPEVDTIIKRCAEKKTLIVTYTDEVLQLADVVVIDIQCDYRKTHFVM